MADSEKTEKNYKVGDLIEVKDGAKVRRPDGAEVSVSFGGYVLSQSGTYSVDGEDLKVK